MKLFKRLISLTLVIVMMTSLVTVSATSTNAAQADATVESGVVSGFFMNKVLDTALVAAGSGMMALADATDCEELEALTSFIGVWVFGTNPNSGSLERIEQMCEEILDEVQEINEKMDVYSSTVLQEITEQKLLILDTNRSNTFENDVTGVLESHNMKKAFKAYFNEDVYVDTSVVTKEEVGYYVAASKYNNAHEDGFTLQDVEDSRERLFNAFCEIHGNISSDATVEEKAKILFEEQATTANMMDVMFRDTINDMADKLVDNNSHNSYSDLSAQIAYLAYPNLADQRDFIEASLNKQMLYIVMTEMLYEEYLAMRGEYLTYAYPDKTGEQWNKYESDVDSFYSVNQSVSTALESRLNTPIVYDAVASLSRKLGEYPKQSDLTGVTLKNTSYMSEFSDYEKEQPIIDSNRHDLVANYTTDASFTQEFMEFEKFPVQTENGTEMYYILVDEGGDKNSSKTQLMWYDDSVGVDNFLPSCDYYNLTGGTYSDGTNTFQSVSQPREQVSVYSNDCYYLYGSVPSVYLSKYYSQYTDKSLYQIFPTYTYYHKNAFYDDYPLVYAQDMTKECITNDLATADPLKIDGQDIHEGQNGYENGFYYTVILTNNSTELKNNLSYSVSGDGDAQVSVYSANVDGSKDTTVDLNSPVNCGQELIFAIKPDDYVGIKSIKIKRFNDESDTAPTSEEIILSDGDSEYLNYENGCYYITINMPYSDAEVEIETKYELNTDEDIDFYISTYEELKIMAHNVNSGVEEYVNGSYALVNDITVPQGEVWTTPIGQSPNFFKGTFDGQGYTISGLIFDDSVELTGVGLFDLLFGAVVKNLNLANVNFTVHNDASSTTSRVGGLCGAASYNTVISNCTVSGNITATSDSNCQSKYVGGICGAAELSENGIVEKCINYCNVDADADDVGGICGYATNDAVIKNCANIGNVKAYQKNPSGIMKQPEDCGGIIGETQSNATAINCYNAGNIAGTSNNGAVIGNSVGDIPTNCYYLDTCGADDEYATVKTDEQFKSGEVCYLLNKGVGITNWAWFQNIDNGNTPDDYPTLTFTKDNIVIKVDRVDKTYSNLVNYYLRGDVDLDGQITVLDATAVQMYCAKLCELGEASLANADVTNDKIISITDATKIQGYVALVMDEL